MTARAGETNRANAVPALDRLLFFVLTAVLCARPLMSESFERAALSFLPDVPTGTTPATTVWLDGILLLTAITVWVRHWRNRVPRLVAGALVLLLCAVVVSVLAADNKRTAANAGAHLFVMAAAAAALVRVMRTRWMVHVLIAAVLAGGVTNAVKCVSQRVGEFDATLEQWQQRKAMLAADGADVDSPMIVNYERRLRSGETFGYLFHPNVTGSFLATCSLIAVGILIGVLRKPWVKTDQRIAAVLVAALVVILLAAGLWLTGSTGAGLAGAVAGLLLLLLGLARRWVAGHMRGAFALLVGAYVVIIAIGAGYGLLKGTLPHTSLAFRWQYWQAAAQAYADEPLSGIGRENFRAAYLLYKPPESTEEVNNPHNLWLTLLVELGPLALIAGALLIGTAIRGALRALAQTPRHPPTQASKGAMIAAAIGVLLVQALFSGEPFGSPGILTLWSVYVAGVWLLAFAGSYSLIAQADEHPDATPWLVTGLTAALCAALIHNLIGISLFIPAGLAVFVVIAAGTYALQQRALATGPAGRTPAAPSVLETALPVGLSVFLVPVYVAIVAWPTIHTDAVLERAKAEFRAAPDYSAACGVLERGQPAQATEARLWDPTIPSWSAEMALQLAQNREFPEELRLRCFRLADDCAGRATRCTPRSFAARRLRASVLQGWAEHTQELDRLRAAETAWSVAVSLYPTDPRTHIAAARVQFLLWMRTDDADFAQRALGNYHAALAIDGVRKPEVAVKLRPAELRTIRDDLDELRAAGFDQPAPAP